MLVVQLEFFFYIILFFFISYGLFPSNGVPSKRENSSNSFRLLSYFRGLNIRQCIDNLFYVDVHRSYSVNPLSDPLRPKTKQDKTCAIWSYHSRTFLPHSQTYQKHLPALSTDHLLPPSIFSLVFLSIYYPQQLHNESF